MSIDDLLPHDWKAFGHFSWLNCYTSLVGDGEEMGLSRKTSVIRLMVHVLDDLIERQRLLVGVGESGEWYNFNARFLKKHLKNIFRLNRNTKKN